jgi:hypothetical protein
VRAYVQWAPVRWASATVEYEYERLRQDDPFGGRIVDSRTRRLPVGVSFFGPAGTFLRLRATGVDQEGQFPDVMTNVLVPGSDRFWVADATIGYRLPKRLGIVSVEGRNLFDKRFNYQDTDPANPRIAPERLVLIRVTLAY